MDRLRWRGSSHDNSGDVAKGAGDGRVGDNLIPAPQKHAVGLNAECDDDVDECEYELERDGWV